MGRDDASVVNGSAPGLRHRQSPLSGRLDHAARDCREYKSPCVIIVEKAAEFLAEFFKEKAGLVAANR
jgi:hypothetical protein